MVLLSASLPLLLPCFLPFLPVGAADGCQPATWSKVRNKARDVATGATPSSPAATDLAAAADFQVPVPARDPLVVRRDPLTIQPGDFICRLWIETGEDVNYWTCSDMAARFKLTRAEFFDMNPNLLSDCSNIEPETEYCVKGFIEPLRSTDGFCGPSHNGATCSGTAAQCCNSETWTCGNSDEDCDPGICYEGACPGHHIWTTDGTCGYENGGRRCAGKWGECCNLSGACGSGALFCGTSVCQSGKCEWKTGTTMTASSTMPSSSTVMSSTTTVSSAAPTVTDCNFGTGPGGYLGLCEYSCTFGFCPPPCTCTSPGTPVPPPALTGDTGYAVLGLAADFGPLCHFTVSHGYIPTGVCTNIPYTTSPGGTGTACVTGEGTGEYEGLCDFCCYFGYCPSGVCTCTLYGQPNTPPPVLNTPGIPAPGHDESFSGLCSFTCNHGYCPPAQCTYP